MVDTTALIGNVSLVDLVLFILLFWFTVFIAKTLSLLVKNFLRKKTKGSSYKIIAKIINYTLIFSSTYFGLQYILGFDFTALIASFGIIGIAIAFSAQEVAKNLIGGIFIFGGGIIKLGDWIIAPGFPTTGLSQVKDISLTKTTLREDNGSLLIIPNSSFINNKIIKYPEGDFFKIPFEIKISKNNDLKKVEKIIFDICNKNEKVLPNIPTKEKYGLKKILKTYSEENEGLMRFLRKKIDIKRFEPFIFVNNISENIITLGVWIWVWEITKKENIISNIMEELLEEFSKNKVKLV